MREITVYESLPALLQRIIDPGIWVRLYRTSVDPTKASVFADFTECDFPGYADVEVSASGLPIVLDAFNRAYFQCGTAVFSRAAGIGTQLVYGYLVYTVEGEDNDPTLLSVQPFESPKVLDTEGQQINVAATLLLEAPFPPR